MHRFGIGLMGFAATAMMVLIGIDVRGSSAFAALILGAGALAAFFAGCTLYSRTRSQHAESTRGDNLTDDVEHQARIHSLEDREAELVRQIASLEARRDEILAELAAAVGETGRSAKTHTKPNLTIVPEAD